MSNPYTVLELTSSELFFLCSLLGAKQLFGVKNLFAGWLSEQIEADLKLAYQTMTERNIIEEVQPSQVLITPIVAGLVSVISFPEAIIMLTLSHNGLADIEKTYFWRKPFAVKLISTTTDNYQISALDGVASIYTDIWETWSFTDCAKTNEETIFLQADVLREATQAAQYGNLKQVQETLTRCGVSSTESFANTLAGVNMKNGALATLLWDGQQWFNGGFGFIQGDQTLWRLRAFEREGVQWIESLACAPQGMQIKLQTLLDRFLSEQPEIGKGGLP